MVNVDLSKIVSRGSLSSASALIPGLFFEISILLGSPNLITGHLGTTQKLIPLNPYLQLAIALFLAWVIGQAFMLLVSLIQHLLTYVHSARLILLVELRTSVVIPLTNWLADFRFFSARRSFQNFRVRLSNRAVDPQEEADSASQALHKLASKLFLERFGVNLSVAGSEWEPMLWAVGSLTEVEWRGPILMIASEAIGWCGLVATTLAPALRNRYYIGLSAVFLLTGLHNDYYVAARRTDPAAQAAWKTRAILREYEKDPRTPPTKEGQESTPDEAARPLA